MEFIPHLDFIESGKFKYKFQNPVELDAAMFPVQKEYLDRPCREATKKCFKITLAYLAEKSDVPYQTIA